MHACSVPCSADGELSEMEVERIKQEMEDHIDDLADGKVAVLTAEEMRMIMGEEKDDLKKILRVRART